MRNLRHFNICKLQHVIESENSYYICMTHYEGGNLLERHIREAFTFSMAQEVMQQVLTALAYCHRKGIVHRDVKPENILMQKSGQT